MSDNSTEHVNEAMNKSVANKIEIPSETKTIKSLGIDNNMAYIAADAYIGNPYALLGNVIEIRKIDGVCPAKLNSPGVVTEFSANPISGIIIDEESKIKEPIKRESITVDQKLSLKVGFLNYLNAELEGETSFSIMVFDQLTGLIKTQDPSWKSGLAQWKTENKELFDDDEICYLFGIIGIVQKYVIRKKYKKFTAGAKGGGFGVNLDGQLYTSSEDYSLDIRFGLQPVILKRPEPVKGLGLVAKPINESLTVAEQEIFRSITKVRNI